MRPRGTTEAKPRLHFALRHVKEFTSEVPPQMLQAYIPILLVVAFVIANAIMMLGLSHVLSTYRLTPVKLAPYESGMPVLGDARDRFSIKFYLVAMLFILFDIETVFMLPWAAAFQQLTPMRGLLLAEMFVFVAILAVGYLYVWKRGALEWD
jgi:NADH-quinone oxidoreductase subunit A